MIKIENVEVNGWEAAIRGMRNPMNSWDKSDSYYDGHLFIGENDHMLMMKLADGGSVHAKYRRMITVSLDITAPLYWWKEFDTYKVGTVRNSCSTMHKIHAKEFTLDDFSHEHLNKETKFLFDELLDYLNVVRNCYNSAVKDGDSEWAKNYWWQMIQLLPSSYNQRATVMLNYEVLAGMYRDRRNHKLDCWCNFCKWIENLPYSEVITCGLES